MSYDLFANAAAKLRKLSYYDVNFGFEVLETIAVLTSPVVVRFDYGTTSNEYPLY